MKLPYANTGFEAGLSLILLQHFLAIFRGKEETTVVLNSHTKSLSHESTSLRCRAHLDRDNREVVFAVVNLVNLLSIQHQSKPLTTNRTEHHSRPKKEIIRTYLKPLMRPPNQPLKLLQRPLLPPARNQHRQILAPNHLSLPSWRSRITSRHQFLVNQQARAWPRQGRGYRFDDLHAFAVRVVVQAAPQDEGVGGVGCCSGLCVVVAVGLEGDARVGLCGAGRERGDSVLLVGDYFWEVLVHGLEVGKALYADLC